MAAETKPWGFFAVGIFLCFGATMAALAAVTLLWRGTVLDRAWVLNPRAYRQLDPVRSVAGPLFLLLCALLISAAIGWFQRRRWGWRLTVAIMAIQMSGDVFNLLRGDWLRAAVGVTIAGALLLYLFTPKIRTTFRTRRIDRDHISS